ncbi:Protein NEP-17 a, partial [Aphelenchoides avenae]
MVDVDYAAPKTPGEGPAGYRLYVDQNTLVYPKSYYAPGAFQQYRKLYEENVFKLFTLYGNVAGYVPDNATIKAFTDKIINLELTLANATYSTDDNTRRDYSRFRKGETTVTDANKQYTFIDWGQYISESLTLTDLSSLVKDAKALSAYSFYVMETDTIKTLSDNLQTKPALQGFEPDTVVNYLFFRLILANKDLLPAVTTTTFHKIVEPSFTIGRQRRGGPRSKAFHRERDPFEPRFLTADADAVAFACAYQAEAFLQYALARVFTDVKYPTADAKAKIK